MSQLVKVNSGLPVFQDYKSVVLISSETNTGNGYTSSSIDCSGYNRFSVGIKYGATSAVAHYNQIEVSNDGTNWFNILFVRFDTSWSNANTHIGIYMNASYIANGSRCLKNDESGSVVFPCMWKYIRVKINSGNGLGTGPVSNTINVDRLEVFLAK